MDEGIDLAVKALIYAVEKAGPKLDELANKAAKAAVTTAGKKIGVKAASFLADDKTTVSRSPSMSTSSTSSTASTASTASTTSRGSSDSGSSSSSQLLRKIDEEKARQEKAKKKLITVLHKFAEHSNRLRAVLTMIESEQYTGGTTKLQCEKMLSIAACEKYKQYLDALSRDIDTTLAANHQQPTTESEKSLLIYLKLFFLMAVIEREPDISGYFTGDDINKAHKQLTAPISQLEKDLATYCEDYKKYCEHVEEYHTLCAELLEPFLPAGLPYNPKMQTMDWHINVILAAADEGEASIAATFTHAVFKAKESISELIVPGEKIDRSLLTKKKYGDLIEEHIKNKVACSLNTQETQRKIITALKNIQDKTMKIEQSLKDQKSQLQETSQALCSCAENLSSQKSMEELREALRVSVRDSQRVTKQVLPGGQPDEKELQHMMKTNMTPDSYCYEPNTPRSKDALYSAKQHSPPTPRSNRGRRAEK